MHFKLSVLVIALSIAASGTLFASEIYKSIDSEGNVFFSDIPTVGAERLLIRSRPTDPASVQSKVQARADSQTQRAEEEAKAPQGPTPEDRREQARERADKCKKYRARQTAFKRSRRIYKMENGERVYYDEQEMQDARNGVDDQVQEFCN